MVEKQIKLLEQAWCEGKLPILNGIVKNTGEYYTFENSENQIVAAPAIPFSFDFSGGDFSDIDPMFETETDDYKIYCGEGSWGGDGFIYVENRKSGKMLWYVFADFLNPIIKCEVAGNLLIAENNNECRYIFDLENPENSDMKGFENRLDSKI